MITRQLLDDPELLFLKRPEVERVGEDPAIVERVSAILLDIERGGEDALRRYARELDGWEGDFELTRGEIEAAEALVPETLREHLQRSRERTEAFARAQRSTLQDLEVEVAPGVIAGHRLVPVSSVGAYLPAGRVPLLASPFMTVLVPKVAGVGTVVACAPPQRDGGGIHPSLVYSTTICGADRIFALGGVQALAAMAFGLGGIDPVDMVVGAGNAYVAEAKRQLYGRVGIDLLAGPSEVAVLADETADAELVAADLLGQAEHGPTSPVALVTTSEELGRAVRAEVTRQLEELATADVAGAAWRDHGAIIVTPDREAAAAVSDQLAPEHLEVQTADDDWFHDRLRNYGSLFLGERATVAFSDKGVTGTNHVLPTGHAARYTGGLSVARFLKPLTYQRIEDDAATTPIAEAVVAISATEGLAAHGATAAKRLARVGVR
ncbi:histidinol dehydrogenase [Solirubrobacter phytolaccae]|uniref:Histidinol dehydrogenase n=1 Tax=Solirubrobacter phytolaccae TaxID=1404360 RepID=A0A9X3S9R8_9ACTN|nr:histidinol dehydrogenase [Solirubrobacter phytolaccae]MDA0183679.1 histidinol dehydrogenase [Solirubrobacter phytolaccae]